MGNCAPTLNCSTLCVDNHVAEHFGTELPKFREPLSLDQQYGEGFAIKKTIVQQPSIQPAKRVSVGLLDEHFQCQELPVGQYKPVATKPTPFNATHTIVADPRDYLVDEGCRSEESRAYECSSASLKTEQDRSNQCTSGCASGLKERSRPEQAKRRSLKKTQAQRRASVVTDWETMEILREAFESVDLDGEGKIDLCGFATCFRTCGLELDLEQSEKLFVQISQNGEYIDFYTLREYLTNNACGSPLLNRVKRMVQKEGAEKSYLVYSMVRRDKQLDYSNDLQQNVLKHSTPSEVEEDDELLNQLVERQLYES